MHSTHTTDKIINIIIKHADWLTEWGMLRVRACFMKERDKERERERERKKEGGRERERKREREWERVGNTKGGRITVLLTPCLTGLESAVWQLTIIVFICKTDYSKPVKQEVNGTVILPLLVFPGKRERIPRADWLTRVRACFMLARVRTPSSLVREREICYWIYFIAFNNSTIVIFIF